MKSLTLAAVAAVTVVGISGCGGGHQASTSLSNPVTSQAPSSNPVTSPATPALLSTPGCMHAMEPVNIITSQGQIDLTTGTMGTGVSPATVSRWSTILGAGQKSVDALPGNTRANTRLAVQLTLASEAAFFLWSDERNQIGHPFRDVTKLIGHLQKVRQDCESR
jgi:hypothetical protein